MEDRIRDYHGVALPDVLEAIDYLRDAGDSVIAGGSLAFGLGNALSDLDVVVVAPAGNAESSRLPLQHWVGSLRIDVWKLDGTLLDELLARAEQALAAGGPIDGTFGDVFEEADLKLLHRVAFGAVVEGEPPQPAASRPYREIAGELLEREYAERMRESAFVAELAIAFDDPIAATFNARLALRSALHATVYAHGLPFTGDKWLRERLVGDAPALLEAYESCAVLPEGLERAAAFVAGAVSQSEQLSGLTLAPQALQRDVRFDAGDARLFGTSAAGYLMSVQRDALWELDEAEAEAWKRLGGPEWTCDLDDVDGARLSYALYARGVAALRWTRGIPVADAAFAQAAIA